MAYLFIFAICEGALPDRNQSFQPHSYEQETSRSIAQSHSAGDIALFI